VIDYLLYTNARLLPLRCASSSNDTYVSVRENQVVDSYKKGLRDSKVSEKIHESGATTVAPLMEVVNKLIDTEEALVN
jgi:hypothetical protein